MYKCNSDKVAAEEVEKLKSLIRFSAAPVRVTLPSVHSQKFKVTNDYNKSELAWRNKLGYGPWFLGAFAIAFLSIGYAIVGTGFFDEGFPVFGMFVIGFIGIVFLLVMAGSILKMVRNANTEFAVIVTGGSLEYVERDLAGRIRKTVHFVHADLHAISFSFDTESTFRKIFIYTRDQFEKERNMKVASSLSSIKDLYNFYNSLVSLNMQDITPVEALLMENYLQEQLREKGNVQVA